MVMVRCLFYADHRLHHATRHRVPLRPAPSVSAGEGREPARLHLSIRHVAPQALHRLAASRHRVRSLTVPLTGHGTLRITILSECDFLLFSVNQLRKASLCFSPAALTSS